MDAAGFIVEVCRRAGEPLNVHDPLQIAQAILWGEDQTAEVQMLRRSVEAIGLNWGEFSEADVYLLSLDMLRLVSALREAKLCGQYPVMTWARATYYQRP
jgi:hypothetical protein